MKRLIWVALILVSLPAMAQRRVDLIVDVEGVRRNHEPDVDLAAGQHTYVPRFDTGGGVGAGVAWFFSDNVALEAKVAGLATRVRATTVGSDFGATFDLGYAKIYPVTAVLQWHPLQNGAIRPYLGVGAAYIILPDVEKDLLGLRFEDNVAGAVLNGGLRIPMSKRWSFSADARYIPIETESRVSFTDPDALPLELDIKPLVVGFGFAYHF